MADEKKSIFDLIDKFGGYDGPFDSDWDRVDFSNTNNNSNVPTISFKGSVPKILNVNKKYLISFLISGEYESFGGENVKIELINLNKNLSFSTTTWNAERGWTINTYITSTDAGEFIFQFKVNNQLSNSLNLTFFNSLSNVAKNDCIKVLVNPLVLSDNQKAKFISTVVSETAMGSPFLKDVAWIYFNLVSDLGLEKGLNRSSAYKKKNRNYKLCMYYLGQGEEYKNFEYDGVVLNKYIKENEWFKKKVEPQIKEMKKFIDDEIFISKPKTCLKGWFGQGYWADLDLNPEDGQGDKWYKARQYYWLQLEKKVTKIYVKILKDDKNTTFIFDEDNIIKYFNENPTKLPPPEDVKKFYTNKVLNFEL